MKTSNLILFTLKIILIPGLSMSESNEWKIDINRAERVDPSSNEVRNPYSSRQPMERISNQYPPFHRNRTQDHIFSKPRRQHRLPQNQLSNELPINENDYSPNWNGGYYKVHQKSKVVVPYKGATVGLTKVHGNRRAHRAKIISTIINPGEEWKYLKYMNQTHLAQKIKDRKRNGPKPNGSESSYPSDEPKERQRRRKPCVLCPEERTLITNKKRDRVVFVEPVLKSCKGRLLHSKYKFRSIYGVKPGDLLPAGTHVLVGEISFKNSPIQTCHLRVNVIARQCSPLPTPTNLTVECDAGNLWGSVCTFNCANSNEVLGKSENEVTCNDDLKWIGEVPTCSRKLDSCEIPMNDVHLGFKCQSPDVPPTEIDDTRLPEGTRCRIECNKGFISYPRAASAVCARGEWVGTTNVTCRRLQRRHIRRRRIQ